MNVLISVINNKGIVVMKTDTLYGIVTSAFSEKLVEKIYFIKNRSSEKPFIILIKNIDDLEKFGIDLSDKMTSLVQGYWPGPTSIIFKLPEDRLHNLFYLHRGTGTLAFRVPQDEYVRDILRHTGPLVAPSANIEGKSVAQDISEAKKYFGGMVDYYSDGGVCENTKASSLVRILDDGTIEVIRK